MSEPKNLYFAKTHEWMAEEDALCVVGLTDFAQQQLGSLVFVNLPEVGDTVTAGEAFCDVESVKSDSDVMAPVSGTIAEINEALIDSPELINDEPYEAWLVKIEPSGDRVELLNADEYEAFCESEG